MGFIKLALAGTAAYGLYHYVRYNRSGESPAFAKGEGVAENFANVRNAGRESMRDKPAKWDKQDEAIDASFPASDPSATY